MQQPSTFQVYNASAGSGKTFTLVKEYLSILLTTEDVYTFQKILAITFTNKAAAEMKERVLNSLEKYSKGEEDDLLEAIITATKLDLETVKKRSAKILNAILKNYSAFAITTIDSFTHKLVKSFAYDLNLPLNFEVELDTTEILAEAVDVLLSRIGKEEKLTKLLIDFALEKVDEDKSWDISRELNEIAKVLLNEDDMPHFRNLSDKSISDFQDLKKKLIQKNIRLEDDFKSVGQEFLDALESNNLELTDFTRSIIPNFFSDLNAKGFSFSYYTRSKTVQKAIDSRKYYNKTVSTSVANKIDALESFLIDKFEKSKSIYGEYILHKLILKNITPLAVLNNINKELAIIKEENNIQLNAEFNQIIYEKIKEQPAPFIYERIGQRYQYYFIDEMQDTSVLQWLNLIPLISNALAQEDASLLLVGDGKQAIYRWRGGKAEQFINLSSGSENPFPVKKEPKNLTTNFRSFSEIIQFNNQLFQYVANYLQNPAYKELYHKGNQQEINNKIGGFVNIQFFNSDVKEENNKQYQALVLDKVLEVKKSFSLGEVCIIVRKNEDGVLLANHLSKNGIPVVSSESLLLENSAKVNFCIHFLMLLENNRDLDSLFSLLHFLHAHLAIAVSKHKFIFSLIHKSLHEIFVDLQSYVDLPDLATFYTLPLYDKVEALVRAFHLIETSDAYVQFFLDEVLEQQRKGATVADFLNFWELKKGKLSITAQENSEAVKIMTIHKSKGLEFPVVIFPSNLEITFSRFQKIWFDALSDTTGFSEFYVNYSKSTFPLINTRGEEIHKEIQEALELDTFNLLYVTCTRAVEQLHIISDLKQSRGGINENYTSGILANFMKEKGYWQENILEYSFGNKQRNSQIKKDSAEIYEQKKFITNNWKNHNLVLLASDSKLWETQQGAAIDYGNLLHQIMQEINTAKDVSPVLNRFKNSGFITKKEFVSLQSIIKQITTHKRISSYFSSAYKTYNEREIISKDKQVIIPDRLIFTGDKEVVLLDYKTGVESKKHHQQLHKYKLVLQDMGFVVKEMLLIYCNEKINLVEVSSTK